MTSGTFLSNRIICAVAGLVFAAAAAWIAISGLDAGLAARINDAVRLQQWPEMFEQSWYPFALFGATVLFLVIGIWVLLANARRTRVARAAIPNGTVQIHTEQLADQIAEDLEELPGVIRARAHTSVVRKQKLLRLQMVIDPLADHARIAAATRQAASDFRTALGPAAEDIHFESTIRVAALQ